VSYHGRLIVSGWAGIIGAVVMDRLNIQRYRYFQEAGLSELLEDMTSYEA
jgi:hypothetical protein